MSMAIRDQVVTILSSNAADPAAAQGKIEELIASASPEEVAEIHAELASLRDKLGDMLKSFQVDLPKPNPTERSTGQLAQQQLGALSSTMSIDIFAVMAEFQKSAQAMRNANREIRANELNAQVNTLLQSADEQMKAANFKLISALVQSSVQMLQGAVSLGMTLGTAGDQLKAAEANNASADLQAQNLELDAQMSAPNMDTLRQANPEFSAKLDNFDRGIAHNDKLMSDLKGPGNTLTPKEQQRIEILQNRNAEINALSSDVKANLQEVGKPAAQKSLETQIDQNKVASKKLDSESQKAQASVTKKNAWAEAGNTMMGVIGKSASAGLDFEASLHEANASRLQAQAKLHESASQQANDMMQQMMDVIRDVRDKIQAMDQSRLETTRGIARNI